jgi:pyruvate formate lyase activating enzyme
VTVQELLEEVERDRLFYETSGGGVTLSGGEPCLQAPFAEAFLRACREEGLHTALDTSGCCSWEALEKVAAQAELVLFDLKLYEDQRHRELTGVGRELIFANIGHLAEMGKRLWVRIPIVPGCTDDEANLEGLGRILSPLTSVERIDLLPYHGLAEADYRRLDKAYKLEGAKPPSREEMLRCAETLRRQGVKAALRC